jgi:hypothetical protein
MRTNNWANFIERKAEMEYPEISGNSNIYRLYWVFFYSLRFLITHLVSSNFSYQKFILWLNPEKFSTKLLCISMHIALWSFFHVCHSNKLNIV